MASLDQIKLQLIQALKALFEAGAMSHSGHGNMSARVDADRLVITGVGTLRRLTPDDLAVSLSAGASSRTASTPWRPRS